MSATLLSVLAGEGMVRLVAPQPAELQSSGMYLPDPVAGYRLNPGHEGYLGNRVEYFTQVSISPEGLRGPGPTDVCATRVLVLGDSFVFGQGVNEGRTITAELTRLLGRPGRPVEVVNAGVRGYGTRRQVAWLSSRGAALKPDVVALGIYLGNDMHDNLIPPSDPRLRHGARRLESSIRDNPLTQWAYEHSHLYAILRQLPARLSFERGPERVRMDLADAERTYGAGDDEEQREAERQTHAAVSEFASLTRSLGAAPVAFMIPALLQIAPDRHALTGAMDRKLDLEYPNRVFADALAAAGVPALDMTPYLQRDTRFGSEFYYPVDQHWNEGGHVYGARLVAPLLDPIIQARAAAPVRSCGSGASDDRPATGASMGLFPGRTATP